VGPVVISGYHDHLGSGRFGKNILEGLKAFTGAVGIRRQAQIERYNRRTVSLQFGESGLPVSGDQDVIALETPLQLGL
jgi:hypothetical protein